MKKIYITPSVEIVKMNGCEVLNSLSNAITNSERGIRYGGVDETGSLDPSAKGRDLSQEEMQQLQNTNEWEQGLW